CGRAAATSTRRNEFKTSASGMRRRDRGKRKPEKPERNGLVHSGLLAQKQSLSAIVRGSPFSRPTRRMKGRLQTKDSGCPFDPPRRAKRAASLDASPQGSQLRLAVWHLHILSPAGVPWYRANIEPRQQRRMQPESQA